MIVIVVSFFELSQMRRNTVLFWPGSTGCWMAERVEELRPPDRRSALIAGITAAVAPWMP
ncbi:hypothetical protein AB0L65_13440 [Nonomuraea sp. NPDC052116]|uniref:hypothetical protein n=1 Tax=Nonomuraea sp. NPDC052116 TaxID=3155665 RepID=UPI00343C5198